MTINQLEYFCSAAQQKNFTRAAEEHFVAQTAISQQIKALERELGFDLFVRTKRVVNITPAGQSFYNDVMGILQLLQNAVQKAAGIAMRSSGQMNSFVRIGHMGHLRSHFLPEIISRLYIQNSTLDISISEMAAFDLEKKLESDILDIIFTVEFEDEPQENAKPGIERRVLFTSPLCAVAATSHWLVSRSEVNRSELAGERIVMVDPSIGGSAILNVSNERCREAGFEPDYLMVKSVVEAYQMIEAGICIGFYPAVSKREGEEVVYVPLNGEKEKVNVVAKWNKRSSNQALHFVCDILETTYGTKE